MKANYNKQKTPSGTVRQMLEKQALASSIAATAAALYAVRGDTMWIKTTDDEVINLDNIIEMRATYIRELKYTVVEATAVNGREYFLWQHEGEAVEMAKEWIDKNILKMRGDTNDKA